MAGGAVDDGASYGKTIGLVFVFNLIVGVGALALPRAFNLSGLILGPLFLLVIAFLAYICVEYVLEGLSIANVYTRYMETKGKKEKELKLKKKSDNLQIGKNSINSDASDGDGDDDETKGLLVNSTSESLNYSSVSKENVDDKNQTDGEKRIEEDENEEEEKKQTKKLQEIIPENIESSYIEEEEEVDILKKMDGDEENFEKNYEDIVKENKLINPKTEQLLKQFKNNEKLRKYYENPFSLQVRFEMGKMAELFMGKFGKFLFLIVLIVYLFGDLAIYAVSVPLSVVKVTGGLSFFDINLTEMQTYYLYVAIFGICICPFCFMNISKTKYLQLFTLCTRYLAMGLMTILGLIYIIEGKGAKFSNLKWFDLGGLGTLYGATIYAFMCHHSLPSIVHPIKNKKGLNLMLVLDYISIYVFYICFCFSAVFAFGDKTLETCPAKIQPGEPCQIQSLYTLNFTSYDFPIVGYFLTLFPVFTLTTNYPMIGITLRNNLIALFDNIPGFKEISSTIKIIIFSSAASIPPILIAFCTQKVDQLVSVTGGIAGLIIEVTIPCLLVLFGRWSLRKLIPKEFRKKEYNMNSIHRSIFGSPFITIPILLFSILGLFYNVGNKIYELVVWIIKISKKT